MIKQKFDEPPDYLVDPERSLWIRLQRDYGLTDAPALVLLEQLCRNLSLARECRERVEADGKVTANGREHPLLKVWRDAEKQASSALKSLNFDLEPLRDGPGRPPGPRK
ncbi:MAG: hypothetical protein Q8R21_02625 [Burkholderiales bacterium]|nr:hypothetical protein [Burkholderiales bacterium]